MRGWAFSVSPAFRQPFLETWDENSHDCASSWYFQNQQNLSSSRILESPKQEWVLADLHHLLVHYVCVYLVSNLLGILALRPQIKQNVNFLTLKLLQSQALVLSSKEASDGDAEETCGEVERMLELGLISTRPPSAAYWKWNSASSRNPDAPISSVIRTVTWPAEVSMRPEDVIIVERFERHQAK